MSEKIKVWSPQQATFLDWCKNDSGSCVLKAVAGAGKTTVLLAGIGQIKGQVALMAYNKKIVEELSGKLVKAGINWKKAQAKTAHGFGYGAYKKFRPNVKTDEFKVAKILDAMIPPPEPYAYPPKPADDLPYAYPLKPADDLEAYKPIIVKLVSFAKQRAFGIIGPMNDLNRWHEMADHFDVFSELEEGEEVPVDDIFACCFRLLKNSIDELDVIDFDDMIFMPLIHRVRFWQFDVVMVDEAQDTNPARRALVRAMLRKGGRVIAVGDPHQAIYGFTGADADSLDLIKRDFSCIDLPLTVTYRCPKSVVAFSQQWVRHIVAAPEAPDGEVAGIAMAAFMKRNDLTVGSAVLCRVTKPLVELAFALIRARIPCKVEGRDVGNSIVKLMQRWKVSKLTALEVKLENHLAKETTKLLAKKQEAKLAVVEDSVETIRVIIDQCRSEKKHDVSDAVDYVQSIFGENVSDVLVLSTIHKAKGREWPRVFWLDRANTCPSKWARQEWQHEQEANLCYVAATRSQDKLFELQPAPKKKAA